MSELSNNFSNRDIVVSMNDVAKFSLDTLKKSGFEAWIVGGAVRDTILGIVPYDFDITTSATPEQVIDMFKGTEAHTIETGIKHGTVSVALKNASGETELCEITTYRNDGKYEDCRHPEQVRFVKTIDDDLKRRDFSINSICWSPDEGIYDPYHGIDDIKQRTIKCIGEPHARFKEDALRMLRCARFVSQLGFSVDRDTWRGVQKNKYRLLSISSERITDELTKLLGGQHVTRALIDCADILEAALPEITACRGFDQHTKYHAYDVWEHIAHAVGDVKNTPLLRWSALFHDMGKPSTFFAGDDGAGHFYGHEVQGARIAHGALKRLSLSKQMQEQIETLILRHNDTLSATEKSIRTTINLMGGDVWLYRQLLALKRADSTSHATAYTAQKTTYDEIEAMLDKMLDDGIVFDTKSLNISGNDIIALGVSDGKKIGELLGQALLGVECREVKNNSAELLAYIQKRI